MNKKNKSYRESLTDLLSFLDAKNEMSPQDVDQALSNAGYNPAEVGKKFQEVANQSMAKSPQNWRYSAHIAYENAKADFLKSTEVKPSRSRSEILDAINALLSQQNLKLALAHRNFLNQTDEDLESLLCQLEYIASQKSRDSGE